MRARTILLLNVALLAPPVAALASEAVVQGAPITGPTMPAMLRLAVTHSRAAEVGPAYHVAGDGHGANPRHGLDLIFTAQGLRVDGSDGGFALRLERFGRDDGRPVRRGAPRTDGAWVEYERGDGLTEWFVNLPHGVEQGWTVARRPAGRGPLVLALDTARPPDRVDDGRLIWSGLVYDGLVAVDADGRELPSGWVHDGTRLRIEVEDRDAVYPVLIDPWVQQAKLTAADGAADDLFGDAVALSGDTALVGADEADVDGKLGQGAAYVFTRSGAVWSQQAKLTAADGEDADFFGNAVALSGDTALVGASFAGVGGNGAQGAAYVFTRSGSVWSQQAKLTAADGEANDFFGRAVALSGDTAVVGAVGADVGGNTVQGGLGELESQGAAYVYTRNGAVWSQQAKLTAADGEDEDFFGNAVTLSGDTALVGADEADVGGAANQGAAYVFTRSGSVWSLQVKLTAADGTNLDRFGLAVALSGDTALVGAPFAQAGGNADQGAAYVFTRNGAVWSQQAKLAAADGVAENGFGFAVAFSGDTALVGAPGAGNAGQGAAYVFTRGGAVWSEQAKLTAADGEDADFFGIAVAFSGDTALVGAGEADVGGNADQGAAYVYAFETGVFTPVALTADSEPLMSLSDGNLVFEPGERVEIAPAWRNDGTVPLLLDGTASGFTGPAGPTYTLVVDQASYGEIAPGAIADCLAAGICYQMEIGPPGVVRPALHWDALFDETLSDETVKGWTLHVGDSFTDVPRQNPFYRSIETVLHRGVSGDPALARRALAVVGCAASEFCPAAAGTRAEAAVFLLQGLGASPPPDCVADQEQFADVPADDPYCPWIEELADLGVTAGCGGGNYCPGAAVTRGQMAILLLKTLEGPQYVPPDCNGIFTDVLCPSTFANWIEELFIRGITAGCTANPPAYCPAAAVTRAQLAALVVNTFGLTLYGP